MNNNEKLYRTASRAYKKKAFFALFLFVVFLFCVFFLLNKNLFVTPNKDRVEDDFDIRLNRVYGGV